MSDRGITPAEMFAYIRRNDGKPGRKPETDQFGPNPDMRVWAMGETMTLPDDQGRNMGGPAPHLECWPESKSGCEWCAGIATAGPDEVIDHDCDLCKRPLDPESLRAVARGDVWQGPIKPEPNQHAITLNRMAQDASSFWED